MLNHLISANIDGMKWRDDLMLERPTWVGEVTSQLTSLPKKWQVFDTRNNQIALVAAKQIEQQVMAAKEQYGAERIAVIIGTSTSGIATGEQALAYQAKHGSFPTHYDYSQQELGDPSQFLQCYFGLMARVSPYQPPAHQVQKRLPVHAECSTLTCAIWLLLAA